MKLNEAKLAASERDSNDEKNHVNIKYDNYKIDNSNDDDEKKHTQTNTLIKVRKLWTI